MQKRVVFLTAIIVAAGFPASALAGCWGAGWGPYSCLPPAFYGCIPHLGLGPGYPGLFPPTYLCPPDPGFRWAPPYQTIVVIPGPPVPIYASPEGPVVRNQTPEGNESTTISPANYSDEVERAHKLYPRGIPSIEYMWSPDHGVETLHDNPPPSR